MLLLLYLFEYWAARVLDSCDSYKVLLWIASVMMPQSYRNVENSDGNALDFIFRHYGTAE